MIDSQFVHLSGLRIRVLTVGEETGAPPLVLLHGGGTDSATLSWGGVIEPLGRGRRIIAPDLPGYGESDRPDAPYSLNYYCTIVAELVDALGLDRFDLGGLSMGGGISLAYTLSHRDRVRRLVLVDTYGIQPDYPPQWLSYLLVRIPLVTELTSLSVRSRSVARASLGQLVRTPGALTEELVDAVMAESRKPRAGKAFNTLQKYETLRTGLRTNYMPQLDQIAAPTLIIHGSADTLVPLKYAKDASWRIPDCRLEVLKGAGHWAQRDQPEAFVAAMNEFLSAG
jgi:pimeloyl-ACP methyl ester carboxylesterase